MTRRTKILVIAVAVSVAAVAFAVARPGGSDDVEQATPTNTVEQSEDTGGRQALPQTAPETPAEIETVPAETIPPQTEAAAPPPKPKPLTVRTRRGKPVGGVKKLTVRKSKTVRFVITSDVAEEVHVHGYDIIKDVGPGAPARFRFRAEFEGIFEVELEGVGEQILELRVEP